MGAETDAIAVAGAEDGAKTERGEDGEEEGGEPVREIDGMIGVERELGFEVAKAVERQDSARWFVTLPPALDSGIPRMRMCDI